jgi:hypothetical protein
MLISLVVGVMGIIFVVLGLALSTSAEPVSASQPLASTLPETTASQSPESLSIKSNLKSSSVKSKRIAVVIVVVILAVFLGFPTVHSRTRQESYLATAMVNREEYLRTLDCSTTLPDGQSLEFDVSPLNDSTRFVFGVTSTQEIRIMVTGRTTPILYEATRSQHFGNQTGEDWKFSVEVWNPSLTYTGPSAEVSGNIKVYRIYQAETTVWKSRTVPYTQWLPWWMP